jgi:glutamine cyclotransferase
MARALAVALLLLVAPPAAADCGAPRVAYQVAAEWPHRPDAFTQGLVMDGDTLLEGTGLYGRSSLARLDPESGRALAERALAERYFGEGVTVLGERIWQLTWKAGRAFVYRRGDLAPLDGHRYAGEGWGLTHDGRRLVMSDGSHVLQLRDPDSFALLGERPVHDRGRPVARLNELEMAGGVLYANVWPGDCVARVDPASGTVTGWLDLAPLRERMPPLGRDAVANGLAWDPRRGWLLATGKLWPRLFALRLLETAERSTE